MKFYAFYHFEREVFSQLAQDSEIQKSDLTVVGHDFILRRVFEEEKVEPKKLLCFLPDADISRKDADYEARKKILKDALRVVTASIYSKKKLESWLEREVDFVSYIPVLTHLADFVNLNARVPYQVVWVGRMVEHKRPGDFITAMGSLSLPALQMVLLSRFGSHPDRSGETFKFLVLKASKALVCSSEWEGFSMTPGEAVVCGAVPIVSDIEVHKEVYPDFPKFAVGDLEGLKARILEAFQGKYDADLPRWSAFVRSQYGFEVTVEKVRHYLQGVAAHG